jgi:hypothetical protein
MKRVLFCNCECSQVDIVVGCLLATARRVYESPSWVATRLRGKLQESRSFSAPLSSPESPRSSPLPLPSTGNCDARKNCW